MISFEKVRGERVKLSSQVGTVCSLNYKCTGDTRDNLTLVRVDVQGFDSVSESCILRVT